MMVALHHMAIAEKTYFSLQFLAKKFFRKDVGFILKAYILEKENDLFVQNFNGFCTDKSVTKSMLSLGNDLITVSHNTSRSVPNLDNNRSYRDVYILTVSPGVKITNNMLLCKTLGFVSLFIVCVRRFQVIELIVIEVW